MGNCTVKEQLTTQKVTSLGCGVTFDDTTGRLKLLHYLLFVLQTIFFILRMISRAVRLAPWGLDDTTIVISWACSLILRLPTFPPLDTISNSSQVLTVGFLANGMIGAVVQDSDVVEILLIIATQRPNSALESHTGHLNSGSSRPRSRSILYSRSSTQ